MKSRKTSQQLGLKGWDFLTSRTVDGVETLLFANVPLKLEPNMNAVKFPSVPLNHEQMIAVACAFGMNQGEFEAELASRGWQKSMATDRWLPPKEPGSTSTLGRDLFQLEAIASALSLGCTLVHQRNSTWWKDPATGEPIKRNVGELLMLAVSELAEAMEGHRKGLQDDKLPQHPMITVEIADCIIRLLDLAGGLKLNLAQAFLEKMAYNATRADHKPEARLAEGGKKY